MGVVVTDSTCDLPPEQARSLGIEVVPLTLYMRNMAMFDWEDADPDDVYAYMRSGHSISTAPVPPERFEKKYRELLEKHDFIVSLHLSGKLSDTVKNAHLAAHRLGATDRIYVIDTGLVGYPLTDAALMARQILKQGGTVGGIEKAIIQFRQDMLAELTVPTLDYLYRSGRIRRAEKVVGHLLGLRPVLRFEQGAFVLNRRVREDRAAEDMLDTFRERYGSEPLSVVVAHAGRSPQRFAELRALVKASGLNVVRGRVQVMGPAVGAHVGPGAYSLMAVPI